MFQKIFTKLTTYRINSNFFSIFSDLLPLNACQTRHTGQIPQRLHHQPFHRLRLRWPRPIPSPSKDAQLRQLVKQAAILPMYSCWPRQCIYKYNLKIMTKIVQNYTKKNDGNYSTTTWLTISHKKKEKTSALVLL